jgi:uncharacterized membrane protein YeaQ/YmgE (transglycosylase-associated protein family)
MRFFRRVARTFLGIFRHIGLRGFFLRDIVRALAEPGTWAGEWVRQMRNIGVDSVPLASIVAAFIGAVIAIQIRYQLFPGVQLSLVGSAACWLLAMSALALGQGRIAVSETRSAAPGLEREIGAIAAPKPAQTSWRTTDCLSCRECSPRSLARAGRSPTLWDWARISLDCLHEVPPDFRRGCSLRWVPAFYSL